MGHLYVYIVGQEGGLWGNEWDEAHGAGWSGWTPVPMAGMPIPIAGMVTKPACVANGMNAGEIDCFARGTDTALWHTHLGSGTWESLGGLFDSGPAASTWGLGRLDVFAQGTDEGLWHIVWNGAGWGAWEPVPMEISPATSTATSSGALPVTVTVNRTVTVNHTVMVTTQTAALIPSGNTLYIAAGVLLSIIAAAILLVRRRKKAQ
jgi:LPXTG-motif cell wall-anchored protein